MRRLGLTAVTTLALLLGSVTAASAEGPGDGASVSAETTSGLLTGSGSSNGKVTSTERAEAKEALNTVQEIFEPKARAQARELAASDAEPTLALRDLSLKLGALGRAPSGSELATFQRPWDDGAAGSQRTCADNICLHWATDYRPTNNGADVASSTWATGTVLPALTTITSTYQRGGYRKPVADAPIVTNPYSPYRDSSTNWGGSAHTDIYLRDLGGTGVYGYCAFDLDDTGRLVYYPVRGSGALPVFCVLDNDFSLAQYRRSFAGETSAQIMQVTAAHEYFHAVQFAYDAFEDAWFMEATATWAERHVYPSIPDNRQYLPYSQIRYPSTPLDTFGGARGLLQYADWTFFEFISRQTPARIGVMPSVVQLMWRYADSLGADQYSTQAIASALSNRRLSFATVYAKYATANRRPAQTYLPGTTVPAAAAVRTYTLRDKAKRKGAVRINHLASATYRFKPKKIKRGGHRAKITVNMSNRSLGTSAMVTIVRRNGSAAVKTIKLNRKGNGAAKVLFSKKVAYVELTLVNANRSFTSCSSNSRGYSCGGVPVHDRLRQAWTFKA